MGSTEIPERPERVVVLDTGELDSVLSLGVTPVGAVTTAVADGFLSYLADQLSQIAPTGPAWCGRTTSGWTRRRSEWRTRPRS